VTSPLRIRVLAPFARDLSHGGSQRATALAERLEARGAEVGWQVLQHRPATRMRRLEALARRRPVLMGEHADAPPLPGTWHVTLAAHSYLAGHLPRHGPTVVDFHNLEWQHLLDVSHAASGARRRWLALQAAAMRRAEARAVEQHDLSLFTSESELAWARSLGAVAARRSLVVPNRLPAAAVAQAAAIAAARTGGTDGVLVYVGTLRFPPNAAALDAFVRDVWPVLRAARPGIELHVAAGLRPPPADALPGAPGVVHHGFVADLEDLLAHAGAVVLPFAGQAGSSLRALFLALAGVPLVGPPAAFRGHGAPLGRIASTPAEWARAVGAALDAPLAEAVGAARRLQEDEEPWDRLDARLRELAEGGPGNGAAASAHGHTRA
jgi:hypothetical protein